MNCRHCKQELTHVFCDLQTCPPSNAMVKPELINHPEIYFPLKVFVCEKCWLVQVDELEKADAIFNKLMGEEVLLRKNFISSRATTLSDDELDI